MAQIRLSTDERINVIETIDEIKEKFRNDEFATFTQAICKPADDWLTPDKWDNSPIVINRAHVCMYY